MPQGYLFIAGSAWFPAVPLSNTPHHFWYEAIFKHSLNLIWSLVLEWLIEMEIAWASCFRCVFYDVIYGSPGIECGVLSHLDPSMVSSFQTTQPRCRAASRFVLSQWETSLLCNDVYHWLGANLESALKVPQNRYCHSQVPYHQYPTNKTVDQH